MNAFRSSRIAGVGVLLTLSSSIFLWSTAEAQLASPNWSGVMEYSEDAHFVHVGGIFHVPDSTTCNSTNDRVAIWVGLNGYGSNSSGVEQTGVSIRCDAGYPSYVAWTEMYPVGPNFLSNSVYAGDNIIADVHAHGDGSFTLSLWDVTQNWSYNVTEWDPSGLVDGVSAEAIAEVPLTHSNPNYGVISFAALSADVWSYSPYYNTGNGVGFRQPQPGDFPIYLVNFGGVARPLGAYADPLTYGTQLSPFTHVHYVSP